MVCPGFREDYFMFIYTQFWELMNSMGSHGSLSLPFVLKVMVCHFVNNLHEIMIAFIIVLPLIIVLEIFLQLHQAFSIVLCIFNCSMHFLFTYSQVSESILECDLLDQSFIILLALHDSLFLFVHLFLSLFHPHYISVLLSFLFYQHHDLNFYLCVFLSCICLFVFISLQTPFLFSSISLPIFVYLTLSNSMSINIYFCPYVCLFILVSLFLSLHVTLCVIVFSILNHSFSLCLLVLGFFFMSLLLSSIASQQYG